jgi:hypothetical protein
MASQFTELFQTNRHEKMRATMDLAAQAHLKITEIFDIDETEEPSDAAELVRFLYVTCKPSLGVWLAPLLHYGIKDIEELCMLDRQGRYAVLVAVKDQFSDSDIVPRHPMPTQIDLLNLWYEMRAYELMLGP